MVFNLFFVFKGVNMIIKSKENELIKKTIKLKDKKYRKEFGKFLVEGEKSLLEAYKNGYRINTIFITGKLNNDFGNVSICEVSNDVMKAISTTATIPKCVGVVEMKECSKCEIKSNFLVLDRLQDPSNVGAIIRSALGADFTKVILIDCADVYDSKVIRSSMGAVFNVDIYKSTLDDVLKMNFPLVVMDMNGENIFKANFDKNTIYGFVVGNEGQGVCKELKAKATKTVAIPMNSKLESLNAAVSASIVMYTISNIGR